MVMRWCCGDARRVTEERCVRRFFDGCEVCDELDTSTQAAEQRAHNAFYHLGIESLTHSVDDTHQNQHPSIQLIQIQIIHEYEQYVACRSVAEASSQRDHVFLRQDTAVSLVERQHKIVEFQSQMRLEC